MKYIYLTIAIASSIVLYKFNWFISGNEAIAATSQVATGVEYQISRTQMELFNTIKYVLSVAIMLSSFLFVVKIVSDKNKTNK